MCGTPYAGEVTEDDRADLRLLYEVSTQDIAFFKQQQWKANGYALAFYAAVLAIFLQGIPQSLRLDAALISALVSVLIATIATHMTATLEQSIDDRRKRLDKVRKKLSPHFRNAWSLPKPADPNPVALYSINWLAVISSVLLIGIVAVTSGDSPRGS